MTTSIITITKHTPVIINPFFITFSLSKYFTGKAACAADTAQEVCVDIDYVPAVVTLGA